MMTSYIWFISLSQDNSNTANIRHIPTEPEPMGTMGRNKAKYHKNKNQSGDNKKDQKDNCNAPSAVTTENPTKATTNIELTDTKATGDGNNATKTTVDVNDVSVNAS